LVDGGRTLVACSPGRTATPADKRECVIDRGTFIGIDDCANGTQTCDDDGQWGDCIEL
jgi:hypothetical protein